MRRQAELLGVFEDGVLAAAFHAVVASGRLVDPEEVPAACACLVSDEGPVTGAGLNVSAAMVVH